jgi:hypothetical protein
MMPADRRQPRHSARGQSERTAGRSAWPGSAPRRSATGRPSVIPHGGDEPSRTRESTGFPPTARSPLRCPRAPHHRSSHRYQSGYRRRLGAGGAFLNQWRTDRNARRATRRTERGAAYSQFILAMDHLNRAWINTETLESEYRAQKMGEVTGGAVREIQKAYLPVLLTGSRQAKAKADRARVAAWHINDCVHHHVPLPPEGYAGLMAEFAKAGAEFVEQAEAEFG